MKKTELIKNKLIQCIDELCENKEKYCVNPTADSTRKRTLDFSTVLKTVLSLTDKSLNNKSLIFFCLKVV